MKKISGYFVFFLLVLAMLFALAVTVLVVVEGCETLWITYDMPELAAVGGFVCFWGVAKTTAQNVNVWIDRLL